jgi:hypothetical protein
MTILIATVGAAESVDNMVFVVQVMWVNLKGCPRGGTIYQPNNLIHLLLIHLVKPPFPLSILLVELNNHESHGPFRIVFLDVFPNPHP